MTEIVERFRQRLIDTKCTSHDGSVVVESTERVLSCLTAALSDQAVVPKKATDAMMWAGYNFCGRVGGAISTTDVHNLYKAMIAAAPASTSGEVGK